MSHTVKVTTKITNKAAVLKACQVLRLPSPVEGEHRLYSETVKGLGISLPNWRYPVVINTETGEAKFDNFNGSWGQASELDKFKQRYAAEATKIAAEENGYNCSEQTLDNGDLYLQLDTSGEQVQFATVGGEGQGPDDFGPTGGPGF